MLRTGDAFEIYLRDAEHSFSGWDFSHVTRSGRIVMQVLPWSYASLILPAVRRSQAMLDMGTGGGEFLALLSPLPATTWATEGYQPNIKIARDRLEPLGVSVAAVENSADLPLDDDLFDLVINRHEEYDPGELLRILKPGGRFITQQVGGRNDIDLNRLLNAPESDFGMAYWDLAYAVGELASAGLQITDQREAIVSTRIFDVGALVYHLQAVPWQIADFSVERYRDQLFALHQRIEWDGFIEINSHRFLILARTEG